MDFGARGLLTVITTPSDLNSLTRSMGQGMLRLGRLCPKGIPDES